MERTVSVTYFKNRSNNGGMYLTYDLQCHCHRLFTDNVNVEYILCEPIVVFTQIYTHADVEYLGYWFCMCSEDINCMKSCNARIQIGKI